MMTADTTLAPCPFCGGDANAKPHSQHHPGCYFDVLASLKAAPKADLSLAVELAEAWNRRVPHTAVAAAKAARWDWVCRHWEALNVRFNKDGRTLKRFALTVDANAQGAAGSPRLDSLVDQAIGEEAARGSTSPSKPKPTPCRPHPIYRGPSNCNYGTVGCLEPGHRDRPRPTGASHEQPT